MTDFFSHLVELLRSGESVAVATVIATHGSTPREVGARMLVRNSGMTLGTIGGGCGEAQVWRTALQVLETRRPVLGFVDLAQEISMDSAAICGGTMEVLVDPWSPTGGDQVLNDLALAERILEYCRRHRPVTLATVVEASPLAPCVPGRHMLMSEGSIVLGGLGSDALDGALLSAIATGKEAGAPCSSVVLFPTGACAQDASPFIRLHLDVVKLPPRLVVLGAGHIAIPLSKMAKLLEFDVTVLDDRASFANANRFPEADTVLVGGFADELRRLAIDRNTYIVLITRGHQHDVECLRELIAIDWAYLGMIGSRRRVQAVFELLSEDGVAAERLARVNAPIGIDIGAKTPAEIAISIMAEVVKVSRGGRAASLSDRGNQAQ